MPRFSNKSRAILETCDDRLIKVCCRAIRVVDFSIISGHRSHAEQARLFEEGLSKKEPGQSVHNYWPSLGVDLAPYPIDWENIKRFIYLAGVLVGIGHELGIPLRWGGDWDRDGDSSDQSFMDWGHIEIVRN